MKQGASWDTIRSSSVDSPNNCLFYFKEQVPVDPNMLVFFLLFINDKQQVANESRGIWLLLHIIPFSPHHQ